MKRPAAATGDEEKDKKESLFAKTEKWKQVGTKGTKQPCPSSSSDGDGENDKEEQKRQRGKAKKFKRMADAGAIPDHIWEMFSKEAAKHPKPRQFKTMLINKLFKEDGSGGYIMCAEDPWFQQQKEIFHKRYGKMNSREHQGMCFCTKCSMGIQMPWTRPSRMAVFNSGSKMESPFVASGKQRQELKTQGKTSPRLVPKK